MGEGEAVKAGSGKYGDWRGEKEGKEGGRRRKKRRRRGRDSFGLFLEARGFLNLAFHFIDGLLPVYLYCTHRERGMVVHLLLC